MSHPQPATLAQLKQTSYRYRSIKQELRENLIARLKANQAIFPGIIGYRTSVLPQVIHAILSRHDMLFLGLRGQAKTRMLRMLPGLLDEWIPVIAGIELPDDPLKPMTAAGRRVIAEAGGDASIRWMHRSERYHEKLATPDVTIADLIGEIDIVKHAQGRFLSDEETMHFGMIPRTNRGIFAINELPDLAPRIQVGLFNVLEERDIQIRGYPIRLSLDVCLAFSANPEDYTNRGRIVTPLKDRIGSVIRTHYPATIDEAMDITKENAWVSRSTGEEGESLAEAPCTVEVPEFMHRVIEQAIASARVSPHINQASGVSVRASISCMENMISSAERRALSTGENRVLPRICDLSHLTASCRGKIELMIAEDAQSTEDKLVLSLLGEAVKSVFASVDKIESYSSLAEQFKGGLSFTVGDDVSAAEQVANMGHVNGLIPATARLAKKMSLDAKDEQVMACVGEFLLEVLYVNNLLSKTHRASGGSYRA